MQQEQPIELKVQIAVEGTDSDELDRVTRQLHRELTELEADSVEYVKDETLPPGAKSVDPVVIGALVIALGPAVLTKLLAFMQAWVMRQQGQIIKITIQTGKDRSAAFEIPMTAKPAEVERWVQLVKDSLIEQKKGKKSDGS